MRKRHRLFLVATLAVFAACSSDDTTTAPTADGGDSGGKDSGGDATSAKDAGADVTVASDGGDDGGGDGSSGSDSGGSADGSFDFDGFSKGDVLKAPDGALCFDDDGDGFTSCDGDCDDHNSAVNPCAFDTNLASGDPVGADGLDNDCDGQVDNLRVCDGSLVAGHGTLASDYAKAVDICDGPDPRCKSVVNAVWYGPNNLSAKRITAHMGSSFIPHKGQYMAFFSTGIADDLTDSPSYRPGDGTDLLNSFTHPSPLTAQQNVNPCGTGQSEANVAIKDYTELRLTLKAPANAGSFTFDFNFFSTEYPAYVCRGFNDTFLAMLTSQKYVQPFQIAFDPNAARINVNNSFFQACTSIVPGDNLGYTHACGQALSTLNGTGYEIKYGQTSLTVGNLNKGSGATNWLKTTAPIQPGETFTLSFIVFDEADGILDSAVNLDNFRWNSTTLANPVTAR